MRFGSIRRAFLVVFIVALFTIFCVMASASLCPDFIQFWTAGKIIRRGGDPYDVALQAAIQRDLGWDRQKNGLGLYDFMPFYYPPWLAIACVPFAWLDYSTAKLVWFVLNSVLLLASAYLVRGAFSGVSSAIVLTTAIAFAPSLLCLQLGQTAILVLFLVVCSWRLVECGRDGAAGVLLASTTIKPQLSALLLFGMTLWAVRRGRWRIPLCMSLTVLLFVLASTLVLPAWLVRWMSAPRVTPMPMVTFPWNGTTWFLLLKGSGLSGPALWVLYGVACCALLAWIARRSFERGATPGELASLSMIGAFWIAPYGRVYDFPVLLFPLWFLLAGRLPEIARGLLLLGALLLPYLYWGWVFSREQAAGSPLQNLEIGFFGIPIVLLAAWISEALAAREARRRTVNLG
jgi:hypothetical protein